MKNTRKHKKFLRIIVPTKRTAGKFFVANNNEHASGARKGINAYS